MIVCKSSLLEIFKITASGLEPIYDVTLYGCVFSMRLFRPKGAKKGEWEEKGERGGEGIGVDRGGKGGPDRIFLFRFRFVCLPLSFLFFSFSFFFF